MREIKGMINTVTTNRSAKAIRNKPKTAIKISIMAAHLHLLNDNMEER